MSPGLAFFKRALTKFALQKDPDCGLEEAIGWIVHSINDINKVGNHSPYERVLGLGGPQSSANPFSIIDEEHGETRGQLRLLARQAFLETEYIERRRHAELARNRVYQTLQCGEPCFFWRLGKGKEARLGKMGGLYGTARVLCQEQRVRDGHARPSSVVWVAYGDVLLRCAPEQLRAASEAGYIVFELQRRERTGGTIPDVLENCKKGTYGNLLNAGHPTVQEFEGLPEQVSGSEAPPPSSAQEPVIEEPPAAEEPGDEAGLPPSAAEPASTSTIWPAPPIEKESGPRKQARVDPSQVPVPGGDEPDLALQIPEIRGAPAPARRRPSVRASPYWAGLVNLDEDKYEHDLEQMSVLDEGQTFYLQALREQ